MEKAKGTTTNKKKTPEERIKDEEKRLVSMFKNTPKDKMIQLDGLIKRAAQMRVMLEDWELDMLTNGYVEMFQQSEKCDPYERERPIVRLYNSMNKNYQSIMKQLGDALPKVEVIKEDDGFDDFVNS